MTGRLVSRNHSLSSARSSAFISERYSGVPVSKMALALSRAATSSISDLSPLAALRRFSIWFSTVSRSA